jgi:glycosyltransferase involved in cell wall biosynthesis
MKLVILLPTLPVYRKDFLETLNLNLQNKNIELSVLHGTSFFKKSVKSDINPNYPTIPLNTIEFKLFGFRIVWWRAIFRNIYRIKPDIVIILFSPGNITFWIVQLYCYLNKIKVGLWSSGFIRKEITGVQKKIRSIFLNFFLTRAKFHICYGTKYKRELLELGIDESKIFVAQNTINIEKIIAQGNNKTYDSSSLTINFLFVGALIKEKKLDMAIKAIAKLILEGFDIQFNIIGQGSILNELNSLVINEKMENNIFVLGPKYDSELSLYFNAADIFLLPGTGGLAINEAMAYRLPIITTIGDGTVIDLVLEDQNGYYLDEVSSLDNIYETCKKALIKNKSQLREMGIRSSQIIQEKASLKNMVFSFESAILQE